MLLARLFVILYATTIFLSAFLLFQVQPLIAKIILPGSAGRLRCGAPRSSFSDSYSWPATPMPTGRSDTSPPTQARSHVLLLVASCLLLPIPPVAVVEANGSQ